MEHTARKIRVLHVVRDDKFIDGQLSAFEQDGRFDNRAAIITNSPDYKFQLVKNTERIKILYTKKMVIEELHGDEYDVIYFYSIPLSYYRLFHYIPKNKIVIWWTWGYDIYEVGDIIKLPLYKPLTRQYISSNQSPFEKLKYLLKKIPLFPLIKYGSRKIFIERINYFQPVIHTEFVMMQGVECFKAKEFYSPVNLKLCDEALPIPSHGNNIIVGHSATTTNNHLDVWEAIKNVIPEKSTIYIPISYGSKDYANYLETTIVSKVGNVCFLRDLLPMDEYYKIIDSCSYAVFGVVRQAAIGNIFRCINKGVKVFLYQDSIPYKYYQELGCMVFSIEEINNESFSVPLTLEQVKHNRHCLRNSFQYAYDISESAIKELQNIIQNKS